MSKVAPIFDLGVKETDLLVADNAIVGEHKSLKVAKLFISYASWAPWRTRNSKKLSYSVSKYSP